MRRMTKQWIFALAAWLILSASGLMAQKPMVAAVVWDDRAKEGEDLGEIRIYQLGESVQGLTVKVKYEGSASDGS